MPLRIFAAAIYVSIDMNPDCCSAYLALLSEKEAFFSLLSGGVSIVDVSHDYDIGWALLMVRCFVSGRFRAEPRLYAALKQSINKAD